MVGSIVPEELAAAVAGDSRLDALALSLRERLLERVSGGALELPLLPQVAVEVLSLSSRDDSDSRRLSDLLKHDPAMTAHVLRMGDRPAVLHVVGAMHAHAGGSLARRWGLPPRVTEAISGHHDAEGGGAPGELTMLVALADDLAHFALDPDPTVAALTTHWTLPRLNMPATVLDEAVAMRQAFAETLQAIA